MNRLTRVCLLGGALLAGVLASMLAGPAAPAAAHPLGSYSVNQYLGLTLRPDRVDAAVEVDRAELPTLQNRPAVDTDGDGAVSPAESSAYAATGCREVASAVSLRVAGTTGSGQSGSGQSGSGQSGSGQAGSGRAVSWRVGASRFALGEGSGGLPTSRLTCALSATAWLARHAVIEVSNGYAADRVGWRELVAVG